MSERENELLDNAIDPPENQGGGKEAAISLDSPGEEAAAIDPPSNDGGT